LLQRESLRKENSIWDRTKGLKRTGTKKGKKKDRLMNPNAGDKEERKTTIGTATANGVLVITITQLQGSRAEEG